MDVTKIQIKIVILKNSEGLNSSDDRQISYRLEKFRNDILPFTMNAYFFIKAQLPVI
jgi:hypothetical protein